MKSKALTLLLTLSVTFNAFCQAPPEFFTGLKQVISADRANAKINFLIAVNKAPNFFGSYHFLGALYQSVNNLDSAAWYLNKAIALNNTNVNHTKELSYVRLINNYTYQHDFKNGFALAWEALKLYPDNNTIKTALKDLCLWAFYIKYDQLDPSYLSMAVKDEYLVNSVAQEYLITRKIRVDDDAPVVAGQSLVSKNNASYDVLTCTLPASKKSITLNFKLNWDMTKDFGGKTTPTDPVINNTKNPIYERIGGMLVADDKLDVKQAIEKLL
jgi:tetratricopeptide (TPR) repeat protein